MEGIQKQKVLYSFRNGLSKTELISTETGIKIPTGGLYFSPLYSGKINGIAFIPNPSNFSAGLYKIHRSENNGVKDYNSVAGIERIFEFALSSGRILSYSCYDASLGYDDAVSDRVPQGSIMTGAPSHGPSFSDGDPFYFLFEWDVTAGEEYVLGNSQNTSFTQSTYVYLVLPSVNQQGGGLTGMDFVAEGSAMWDADYVYSDAANNTAVTFNLTGTAGAGGSTVRFLRDASASPQMLYSVTGSGLTVMPSAPDSCQQSPNTQAANLRTDKLKPPAIVSRNFCEIKKKKY